MRAPARLPDPLAPVSATTGGSRRGHTSARTWVTHLLLAPARGRLGGDGAKRSAPDDHQRQASDRGAEGRVPAPIWRAAAGGRFLVRPAQRVVGREGSRGVRHLAPRARLRTAGGDRVGATRAASSTAVKSTWRRLSTFAISSARSCPGGGGWTGRRGTSAWRGARIRWAISSSRPVQHKRAAESRTTTTTAWEHRSQRAPGVRPDLREPVAAGSTSSSAVTRRSI